MRAGAGARSAGGVRTAGGSGVRGVAGALVLAAIVLAALAPAPLAAQQEDPPPDSVRARVLERLQRLSDVARLADTVPVDSLVVEAAAGDDTVRAPNVTFRPRPGAGQEGDTVLAALLELPGYTVTRYEGVRALYSASEGRLILVGTPETLASVRREGIRLTADSAIVYDEEAGRIRSEGNAVFHPEEGDPVSSRVIVYDLEQERGTALGARTRYRETAEWIVTGDLTSVTQDVVHGRDAHFTSCDLETPHYHFRTNELKVVAGRILVARPVTLYFADVPVGWLPFMAQSLERGRASGLLTPRFSMNDVVRVNSGARRRISNLGYYWAMSDYTDSWVALDWFSDEFVSVTGNLRFHWLRQFLRGQASYRQFWRESGRQETAFNTNASWEASERTDVRVSARFASSTDFIRRNSFDPREVTQSINSQGGVNHRFDWGSLSLSANRREFLSDDRVEMTLPSLNLSLQPMTFFDAPVDEASWYNNLTWSGSGSVRRNTLDRAPQADTFFFSQADRADLRATASSSLNLGFLSWAQGVTYQQGTTGDVPESVFERGVFPSTQPNLVTGETRDLAEATVSWNTGFTLQRPLIGTTSISPSVSLSGTLLRSDSIPEATDFVAGPTRVNFQANLRSDLYGFFGGLGPFSAFRHKVSPSFTYTYSPEVEPTDLQRRVFGVRNSRTRNTLSLNFNQTLEAKLREEEVEEAVEEAAGGADGDVEVDRGADEDVGGPQDGAPDAAAQDAAQDAAARRAAERSVTVVALRTSAISYDFVEADSTGEFLQGFTTTRLRNQVSSDFLRGLSLSFEHELFRDSLTEDRARIREFDLHLSELNLSFSFGSSSSIFRRLDFLYGEDEGEAAAPPDQDPTDRPEGMDETQVIPGEREEDLGEEYSPEPTGRVGGWNMNVSYSLRRPRDDSRSRFGREASQMLLTNLRFSPTEKWDLSWRTSYDLEGGHFNDHMVRLSRDLHRWQAHFDFLQTATGNWSFRFEVSLMDNRDLHLDYEQRSVEGSRRRGTR